MIEAILWTGLSFLSGALPFAVWLGRLKGVDVRAVGDRNPGAINAFRAGGKWIGLAVMLLDVSKAAAPIGLAYYEFGWRGLRIIPIAIAPMLGHAFSPFLGFRGGKAIATAMGVWIGLTLWKVPLVGVISITIFYLLLRNSGWAILLTLITVGVYLAVFLPQPTFLAVLALQSALLLWKHRQELRQPPWSKSTHKSIPLEPGL
ncbi:MAG: glycerol-3-phosphate acyltransferase [Anaerolineales bacterium]|nr:glycerol-3-phosphate acyltransferase [Anaerolineales bacterium]MDW8448140.1 glycerol-3-phosphate acyltransferase [Anaerolineales bacterium]